MWELKRRMTSIFIIPAGHPLDFVQELHSSIKLGLEKILFPAKFADKTPSHVTWKKKITQACDTVTFKESAIRFLQEKVDKNGGMAGMSDELFDEQVTSIIFEHDQQKHRKALVLNQIHQSTKVYSREVCPNFVMLAIHLDLTTRVKTW